MTDQHEKIKNTNILKDVDSFIRRLNNQIQKEGLEYLAFLLTCPYPNMSVVLRFPSESFDTLRTELSECIDPEYLKCKNKMAIEFNEILYVFERIK